MNKTYTERCSVELERDLHTSEIRSEIWRDEDGRIHRGHDLPAIIKYAEHPAKPVHVEFRFRGLLERKQGPAIQVIDPGTGVVVREEWYRHAERHRQDGPAIIVRDRLSGDVVHSEMHRSNNPLFRPIDQLTPR